MRDLIGLRRPQICVDLAIVGAFEGSRTHKLLFSDKSSSNLCQTTNMSLQSLRKMISFYNSWNFPPYFPPPPDDKAADNFSFRTTVGADGTFLICGAKNNSFRFKFSAFPAGENFSLVIRRSSQVQCIFNLFLAAVHIFLTVRLKFHIFIMRWSKFSRSWCGWIGSVVANKQKIVAREAKTVEIFQSQLVYERINFGVRAIFRGVVMQLPRKDETVLKFCEHTAPIIAQLASFGSNCAYLTSLDSRK